MMHIDLNSCFATIEQQANPFLRGRPIAIAAYDSPGGCIVAPSVEAKEYGIKTGMRVREGKNLFPQLIVLTPDPNKYRYVHLKLRKLLSRYTNEFSPKSIDEFVLQMQDSPVLKNKDMHRLAEEIKTCIKNEIGDWLTVSIGISTNRFLAKTASGLHKPDGLDEINKNNFLEIYKTLKLVDLYGIADKNKARLNSVGVYSVVDFYNADVSTIKSAFNSISGYYWYLRLRGWEIDGVDFARRSYGNSYALPKPFVKLSDLSPILSKLVAKMTSRLRRAGFKARGVHLAVYHKDGSFWHKGESYEAALFDTKDVYGKAFRLMEESPRKPVSKLAVSCFRLESAKEQQLDIFEDVEKKKKLNRAVDDINNRWGEYVITPARTLAAKDNVPDRIAFGGVKELEEFSMKY